MKSIAEHKYFDTITHFTTLTPISNTGSMVNMSLVVQNQGDTNRIGDKTTGISLECRLELTPVPTAAQSPLFAFRLVIFIWRDDTAPTGIQILQSVGIFDLMTAPLDHDLKVKRKVLHDQVYYGYNDLSTNLSGTYNPYTNVKYYYPLSKYGSLATINYISATTTAVNHIYALFITPNVVLGQWNVNFYSRYNFIDM